jgi:hypothetical protein
MLVSVAAVLAYSHYTHIELPKLESRARLHQQVLDGTSLGPYKYRKLVPWAAESIAAPAQRVFGTSRETALQYTYLLYDFVALSLFLCTLYVLLGKWYRPRSALIAGLFCGGLASVAFRDHSFQPWSMIEAWFFCAALLASWNGSYPALLLLTIAASLNRTTGIFVPVIYLLGSGELRTLGTRASLERWVRFGLLGLAATLVIVAIRAGQGGSHGLSVMTLTARSTRSLRGLFELNLQELGTVAFNTLLFLGAGWLFALRGARRADPFIRRQAVLIPLYLAPIVLFGHWIEVRLLLSLYPVLLALALAHVEPLLEEPGTPGR